ncbi:uncharacterized protein [Aegilops tauschii subsp. strangulata]|uniref:uncharacterized protein isoform X3 n=2 Tax=Aegilops tauschii subsp. strangulata TaxID=200361 RepID=UPI003CC88739
MSKDQKDLKKKGKGGGAICMSREVRPPLLLLSFLVLQQPLITITTLMAKHEVSAGRRPPPPPPPPPTCVQVVVAFGVLRSKGSRWCLSLGLHFVHYFSHPAGYGGRPVPAAAVAAGGWRQRVGLHRRGRHPLHRRRRPDHQRHRQPAGRRRNLATTPRRAPRWLLAVLDFSFHGRFCHSPLLPVVVPVMLLLVLCDLKATDYSIPISAWRELLSTTPATGTWKTQSTVPPMNKAETSIVRIPVRMMLDLLLEHLGLHKAI